MQQLWFRNHTGALINFYHRHIKIAPWLIPHHHLLLWYFTKNLLPLGMLNGNGGTRLQSRNHLCIIRGYHKLNSSIRETKRYTFLIRTLSTFVYCNCMSDPSSFVLRLCFSFACNFGSRVLTPFVIWNGFDQHTLVTLRYSTSTDAVWCAVINDTVNNTVI